MNSAKQYLLLLLDWTSLPRIFPSFASPRQACSACPGRQSVSPGPPNWSWREILSPVSLLPPLPVRCSARPLCTLSLWDDVGTAFSAARHKSPLLHLPSSTLLSRSPPPSLPSSLPPHPPGRSTWSPHLVTHLLPLPSPAAVPTVAPSASAPSPALSQDLLLLWV